MDDARAVRRAQPERDLPREGARLFRRQRTLRQPLAQRLALVERHRDEEARVGLAHVVHGGHVRMVQRSDGPRLAEQPIPGALVAHEVRREHLQRDGSAQTSVPRAVHDPHATFPEPLLDAVRTDLAAEKRVSARRAGGSGG